MKITLPIATVTSLLLKDAFAFLPSQNTRTVKCSYGELTSYQQLSMAAEAETEVPTVIDYGSVNKLPYRQLQKLCKEKGLAANGSTAALRERLLANLGLLKDEECELNDEVSLHCISHG